MADPHALYIVTAVVVLGLFVWVAIVLLRAAGEEPPRAAEGSSSPQPAEGAEVPHRNTKS